MRLGLIPCLALTACASLPGPTPTRAPQPSIAQGATLAFQDFFDSTAAQQRPQDPKLLAYLSPYADPGGTAKHDTTRLASEVRTGRVLGICAWHGAPLCPPDPRGLPIYVYEVFVLREGRDTLQFDVMRVLPPLEPKYLVSSLHQAYTLVSEGSRWRIEKRGPLARVN